MKNYIFFILTAVFFSACGGAGKTSEKKELYIVATTGMIGDAVKNIAGENARVETLMGAGVDPHLYKATQKDLEKLMNADVVFYNGLFLEGKMEDVLEKMKRSKKTVSLGEHLDKQKLIKISAHGDGAGAYDPHIWFDVSLWAEATGAVHAALQEIDSANADSYEKNFQKYFIELQQLHEWAKKEIATIPQQQRLLITSHDAFSYFGRAYEMEVEGLQGISTVADFGLQDVTRLVDLIIERKVKAVFVETSVAPRALQAVVEGCKNQNFDVQIGGTLFSDAMGEEGSAAGNYVGMVKENVKTIVSALK